MKAKGRDVLGGWWTRLRVGSSFHEEGESDGPSCGKAEPVYWRGFSTSLDVFKTSLLRLSHLVSLRKGKIIVVILT